MYDRYSLIFDPKIFVYGKYFKRVLLYESIYTFSCTRTGHISFDILWLLYLLSIFFLPLCLRQGPNLLNYINSLVNRDSTRYLYYMKTSFGVVLKKPSISI